MKQKINNTVFERLTETYLMALCIWAEARNQGLEGMQAVGSVILNRASRPGWWGRDIKSAILCPKQFSCLNLDDPQRVKMEAIAKNYIDAALKDARLRECLLISDALITKKLGSNVGKAAHYHTKEIHPKWADTYKAVVMIRDHIFYEG